MFLPYGTGIAISDQDMVVFQMARNARNFLTSPASLLEAGQCHPMPRAVTMGEHMLGEGLLGAPVWALSRDPILTANAVTLLTYWISAMAAWALMFHWTGNAGAAFVSGLMYGFHPIRLEDPMHPFIIGNQWTAFALLFADRMFRRRRPLDAAALALFLSLQLLESFYTVLGMALIGGIYGLHLAWLHRRTLPATMPLALAALIPPVVVAALVYAPYLETRAAWDALQDRAAMLFFPHGYGFGGTAYPGTLMLVLAGVALLARLRRRRTPRDADDPRLALALAAFAVVWMTLYFLPLPFVTWSIPSLWKIVQRLVPGMDAVRSGGSVSIGLYLVLALLAGFGVDALGRGRSRAMRSAVVLLLVGLWSVETFAQDVAVRSFGQRTDFFARDVRLAPDTLRLYRRIDDGAAADIPIAGGGIAAYLAQASRFLRLHAYDHQPVAACNDSFLTAVQNQMIDTLRQLPRNAGALDALHGLGFRHLVVHLDEVPQGTEADFTADLERRRVPHAGHSHLVQVDSDGTRALYRIAGSVPIDSDTAQLALLAASAKVVFAPPNHPTLWVQVQNSSGAAVFVHPPPLRLTSLLVRWYGPGETLLSQQSVRVLLPLALAPRARRWLSVPVEPPPGQADLDVAISYASRPDEVLLRAHPQREEAQQPAA